MIVSFDGRQPGTYTEAIVRICRTRREEHSSRFQSSAVGTWRARGRLSSAINGQRLGANGNQDTYVKGHRVRSPHCGRRPSAKSKHGSARATATMKEIASARQRLAESLDQAVSDSLYVASRAPGSRKCACGGARAPGRVYVSERTTFTLCGLCCSAPFRSELFSPRDACLLLGSAHVHAYIPAFLVYAISLQMSHGALCSHATATLTRRRHPGHGGHGRLAAGGGASSDEDDDNYDWRQSTRPKVCLVIRVLRVTYPVWVLVWASVSAVRVHEMTY